MKKLGLNLKSVSEKPKSVPDEILEKGLYLSNFDAASDKEQLKKMNISHIVTVFAAQSCIQFPEEFVYLQVPVGDFHYENLIQYFPACCQFIDDALKQGNKVLVHCAHGVSRSATIVLSYLLKNHTTWSSTSTPSSDETLPITSLSPSPSSFSVPPSLALQTATSNLSSCLSYVQSKRSQVLPNPSFMEQLLLWNLLNHSLPSTNSLPSFLSTYSPPLTTTLSNTTPTPYTFREHTLPSSHLSVRIYLTKALAMQWKKVEHTKEGNFVTEEEISNLFESIENEEQIKSSSEKEIKIMCKGCGNLLCNRQDIMEHFKGLPPHDRPELLQKKPKHELECSGFYIRPMKWMGNEIFTSSFGPEVKILKCTGCSCNVGSWSWESHVCSCGTVVSPAFILSLDSINVE